MLLVKANDWKWPKCSWEGGWGCEPWHFCPWNGRQQQADKDALKTSHEDNNVEKREGRAHLSKWVQITWVPLSLEIAQDRNLQWWADSAARWACTLLSGMCCLQLLPPFSGCSTSSVWFVYENKTSDDKLLAFISQKATVPDFLTFIATPSVHQQHAFNRYWKK